MILQEAWSGRRLNFDHMRIFRCIAYILDLSPKLSKFDTKNTKCLLSGYCEGSKACMLMCLNKKKIFKNWNVTFIKDKNGVYDT